MRYGMTKSHWLNFCGTILCGGVGGVRYSQVWQRREVKAAKVGQLFLEMCEKGKRKGWR
jgi:hypothetical protein